MSQRLKRIILLSTLFYLPITYSQVNFSLSGDLVYDQGIGHDSRAQKKLTVRTAEFYAYGAIDQTWDGFFSMASHDLGGENVFEVHELYFESSKLIPRTTVKVGQYFLGIGRLNRYHRHDWEFTNAPLVHEEFLSAEALFDTGAEVNIVLPTKLALDWILGVTTGTTFGHGHSEHGHDDEHEDDHEDEHAHSDPIFYTRLSSFFDWGSGSGLEIGGSYLNRKEEEMTVHLAGIDLTTKKRVGRLVDTLFQAEFWYQNEKEVSSSEKIGFYIFGQKAVGERSFLGLRADYFDNLSYLNSAGDKVDHLDYGLTAQYTFRNSEFFYTRLSLAHQWEMIDSKTHDKDTTALLQFVFYLGAHPTHQF